APIVERLAFSPDGRYLAGATQNQRGWLWDLQAPGKPRELTGENVNSNVQFSPDGKRVILNKNVYDSASGTNVLSLQFGNGYAYGVSGGPDGKRRALAGGNDNLVQVFDSTTGRALLGPGEPIGGVTALAVSRNGQRIAAGTTVGQVRVFEAVST